MAAVNHPSDHASWTIVQEGTRHARNNSCLHGGRYGCDGVDGERGEPAVERVRELTGGFGAHAVLECVGLEGSTRTAVDIARPGGEVGRVGVPQAASIPEAVPTLFNNITISGGVAPARAYVGELLPDVLAGRIDPGRVFDRVVGLNGVSEGYRAMNEREAIKVLIEFPGAA